MAMRGSGKASVVKDSLRRCSVEQERIKEKEKITNGRDTWRGNYLVFRLLVYY
jgi:hypothetical protein